MLLEKKGLENYKDTFENLVQASWDKYFELDFPSHLDDLLVGQVIALMVDEGYSLIDFTSDGVYHYLRFEAPDHHRIVFRLRNLAEGYTSARILGYLVRISIGYGEPVQDTSKVFSALKAELKSSLILTNEPGVIKIDATVTEKFAYAIVELLIDMNDYFLSLEGEVKVDKDKLKNHIFSVAKTLRDYLRNFLEVI